MIPNVNYVTLVFMDVCHIKIKKNGFDKKKNYLIIILNYSYFIGQYVGQTDLDCEDIELASLNTWHSDNNNIQWLTFTVDLT